MEDPCYSLARFTFQAGVLACEDGLSVGIGDAEFDLDAEPDNGVYTVGKGWKIIKREGAGKARLRPAGPDAARAPGNWQRNWSPA